MTATDVSLMPLLMQLSRTRASAIDVAALLGFVCSAVSRVMGIGGAVLILTEPLDGCRISASDGRAAWIGETQLRAEMGPLRGALRTGRPMLTADITRIGPPAMAAAAAECGLVSSLVVPFGMDGERIGALQLLGEAHRPVEPADADLLLPLLEVLATRLADVRDLRQPRASRSASEARESLDGSRTLVPYQRNEAAGRTAKRPADTSESVNSESTAPRLPALAPAATSTTPRSFAPRPTPRPGVGRHSM